MIYYFTRFAPKTVECFSMRPGISSADLATGISGIDDNAIGIFGNQKKMADFINMDGSGLAEVYMAFRVRMAGVGPYTNNVGGLYALVGGQPLLNFYRNTTTPYGLVAVKSDQYTYLAESTPAGLGLSPNTTYTVEIYFKMDSVAGRVKLWINGALGIDFTGNTLTGSYTQFDAWFLGSATQSVFTYGNGYYGELILADSPIHDPYTQRKKIAVLTPNAAGSNNDFTGAYSDVDEIPPSEADYIYTNTAGNVQTFGLSDMPAGVDTIDGVQVWNRQFGEGPPTPRNMQPAIRTGGANFTGASRGLPAINPWYNRKVWSLNPNTNNPWTLDDVNALEAGAKAVA